MTSIRDRITGGSKRSALVKKNIIASFLLKGIAILISLQIVPLTIDYVNPSQYGIWLTLSSLMAWFFFFDIGMTHGFRNRFAEARAKDDHTAAKVYVSTTYAILAIMIAVMLAISLTANRVLDWSRILNIDPAYGSELGRVFAITVIFFGVNIVASTFTTMLTADQKPALTSLVKVLGQATALAAIYLLTRNDASGSLTDLAFIFSGIPVGVTIIMSIILFCTAYKDVRPSFGYIRFSRVKEILGLGFNFFIITTSMLFIFQLMNVIISRVLGPETVTEYNVAYKYFSVIYMVSLIILGPFWSAFTDAYTRKDTEWMSRTFAKLERLWVWTIPVLILMHLLSQCFYRYWIGTSVTVAGSTNLAIAAYILFLIFGNIYMYMINGIGKVRIQMTIYLSFAVVAYPTMTFMCRRFGIPGLLTVPTVVYIIQGVLCRMQLRRIIDGTASGIWNK